MSHYIGGFFKYLAALLIFIFSLSLSYTFFSSIAPANMPWFVGAALGLTEFGLICWLAVFMLQEHHDAHKTLALIMIFVCMLAVIFTDAVELARQFGTTFFLASIYYYGLIVVFCAHLLALIIDFFISYFATHSFRGQHPSPPKGGETVDPLEQEYEQRTFAQTARFKMPAVPFMNRMKAGIQAFKGSPESQSASSSQQSQQESEPDLEME